MPGRPPLTLRPLAAALLLLLATGCTSSGDEARPAAAPTTRVDVPVPQVDQQARDACALVMASLPFELDPGVQRRSVVGDRELTAAWGEPPVTLACGVPDPDRPDEPVTVNGVGWSVRDIGAGYRWTTRDLAVNVAVDIPDSYENGAEIVNPLCAPILAALGPSSG